MSIVSSYVSHGEDRYGWLEIAQKNDSYQVRLHIFGVGVPAEIIPCDDINTALNTFTAMADKYNSKWGGMTHVKS